MGRRFEIHLRTSRARVGSAGVRITSRSPRKPGRIHRVDYLPSQPTERYAQGRSSSNVGGVLAGCTDCSVRRGSVGLPRPFRLCVAHDMGARRWSSGARSPPTLGRRATCFAVAVRNGVRTAGFAGVVAFERRLCRSHSQSRPVRAGHLTWLACPLPSRQIAVRRRERTRRTRPGVGRSRRACLQTRRNGVPSSGRRATRAATSRSDGAGPLVHLGWSLGDS